MGFYNDLALGVTATDLELDQVDGTAQARAATAAAALRGWSGFAGAVGVHIKIGCRAAALYPYLHRPARYMVIGFDWGSDSMRPAFVVRGLSYEAADRLAFHAEQHLNVAARIVAY